MKFAILYVPHDTEEEPCICGIFKNWRAAHDTLLSKGYTNIVKQSGEFYTSPDPNEDGLYTTTSIPTEENIFDPI